ncbi:MAG: ATP-binding cassette domain-containing protein [Dissulfurimicrobium sp.]|uniref:ATP-binding cassette domain-containing protein n=1 Tax=Dissulfurimicrobium TaxID=1769732 RepID=UPI001EDC64E2|nr:ATP-binding cassette domain-containing protein [Dissulfurimicrobium hydrothermale]UKL14279.1 ATP-binding cassette domain-containing protein [Dissulfurimicrobium hydrothermale]
MESSQIRDAAVYTSSLTRRFGGFTAVDHIDMRVPYGEIFGLLGANGAGKSTTIKMLTTLLAPTSGMGMVGGFDIIRHPAEVRRRIGYVPQMLSADGALTGYENLDLSARLYGVTRAERSGRIDEALTFMGLKDDADKLVKNYSGGMIRRLELAQAMLHRPSILFLDEPTIGLDPVARRIVWERLLDLRRSYSMTVLVTTHDMGEADFLCDELAIMHAGRIAVVGRPADLKAEIGPNATMNDVFARYSGGAIEGGGNFRDIVQTRRTASRLG